MLQNTIRMQVRLLQADDKVCFPDNGEVDYTILTIGFCHHTRRCIGTIRFSDGTEGPWAWPNLDSMRLIKYRT